MTGPDMRARAAEIMTALALLTRFPVGALSVRLPQAEPARAVWAYPVAGALVGAMGGAAYWLAAALSLPPVLAAIWALAVLVLASGVLHEDGLADFADGLGGHSRERRLEIMRDSRVGVYGAIALVLTLGLRATAIALLAEPGPVAAGLAATAASSRAAAGVLMAALPPARSDGLAVATGRPSPAVAGVGIGIGALIGMIALPFAAALVVLASAALAVLAVGWIANRALGGQTGDVLGACVTIAECLALTALVIAAG